jgi:hypothetical protein
VSADGAIFESKEEATRYALRSDTALESLYKVEEVEIDAPKGNFTSIAVCGRTGEVLGPPSHHSYQTNLKRVHGERFGDLSLEEYKRSVKVENSEELVTKWKEQQSKATRWTSLTDVVEEGAEPVSFLSRAEFETHFRRVHADTLITEVREAIVHGSAKREQFSPGIGRLLRRQLEDSRKHLFDLAQKLAHGLEQRGLKLFKRRGGKMFVSRVKPRALANGVILSDRINGIVEAVKSEPGLTITKLFSKVAPTPAPAEGEEASKALTDAQRDVMRDMHWLAEEGYLIIYSDDVLFLGVQGDPPHHAESKLAPVAVAAAAQDESAVVTESIEEAAPEAAVEEPAPAVPNLAEHPLPSPEEEEAAAEANEASAHDSDPGAAD